MMPHRMGKRLIAINALRRQAMFKATGDCCLYPGQLPLLDTIIHSPGISQQEAALRLQVSPASVAQSVRRLQESGLIERTVDAENRRRNLLFVTEKGLKETKEYRRLFDEVDERTFSGFTQEECRQLEKQFDRMIDNLIDENTSLSDFPFWREEKE